MRRAAAGLIALALLLVAGTGAVTGAGASTDCAWQKHSIRVVKKVRRHGRARRVARMKHWWTCEPVAASPVPVPIAPPTHTPPTEEPAPPTPGHLGVKAEEWSYTLTRPEVAAGEVVIELNNQGEDPHNLNLRLQGGEGPLYRSRSPLRSSRPPGPSPCRRAPIASGATSTNTTNGG